ncbi:hypothetical protein [Helicobacter equorum]|nr:hypothetical protein [Helicobacter equorum]
MFLGLFGVDRFYKGAIA